SQKTGHPTSAPAISLTTRNNFRASFRGWRLDEFPIFARPPPGGSTHPHPSAWRRRLTPALAAPLCRSRCTPRPDSAVQERCIIYTVGGAQAKFIRMKSASKKRAPAIVNLTVRYLTEREVERLMDCARKHGRYGHRDATMILVAYRHGLRASEVCD